MSAEQLTGADILVRCLAEEGVEHVFGYPGGAVLYIYDAIFKQDKFQHILVRHEQAAVHAADAYSRSSQKVGVAIVTSGPGVTNAVTGLATAYMDSIPMVVISGQVPSTAIGQDAFQECDTVGITRPCVKHNFLVKDVKDLAETVKKAFFIATTGRPGPVLVDIPKDITMHTCAYEYPKAVEMRSYKPVDKGHSGQIRKALQLLLSAERPMIYTGGGIILANASPELNKLVDRLGYPCTNTLMGLGAYRSSSDKFVGMPGMHGTYEANMAMQHCDVLIAIGARFDDRVIGNPKHFASNARKIIHIDIDPSSISKRVKVDIPIVGNVKDVLQELLSQLDAAETRQNGAALDAWWKQINEWRKRDCLKFATSDEFIKPQSVVQKAWELTDGNAFVTSDVGQHQMWAAQYYRFNKPRRWINSGGLGTMGVGLPYAMGVQMANPDDDGALHHRRSLDPDVHPGAGDLQAVSPDAQDHSPEQPLPGHGAPVAADRLWFALFRVLYGFAAGLQQAGGVLWPRRHENRETGRCRRRAARSLRHEGQAGLHELHHGSNRERLADGQGGQGFD